MGIPLTKTSDIHMEMTKMTESEYTTRMNRVYKKIVNMTPHAINLRDEDGEIIESFEPSGETIRLKTTERTIFSLGGTPVKRVTFEADGELPPEKMGTWYIVSQLVASAFKHRMDFLVVNDTTRDENGYINGNRSWASVH